MKIFIIGVGGVGGYFGGLLAKAGNDVIFVARGDHYQAIKKDGLTVNSNRSGNFIIRPAQVIDKISDISNPDLVIFTVKTYHTKEVAQELSKVVNPNTIVITFQNGVLNDIKIKKYLNAEVCPGSAYIISRILKPGIIEQTSGLGKLVFGQRHNSNNQKLKEIETLFSQAGIDATASDDIERDIWKKFIFIAAFSGMTAITRSPIGKVVGDKLTKDLYTRCVNEAIKVAKSLNVNLPNDTLESVMTISQNSSPDAKSSLLLDVENNRPNEIETLNGDIVRLAEKEGVDVVVNQMIYCSLKQFS